MGQSTTLSYSDMSWKLNVPRAAKRKKALFIYSCQVLRLALCHIRVESANKVAEVSTSLPAKNLELPILVFNFLHQVVNINTTSCKTQEVGKKKLIHRCVLDFK